MIIFARFSNEKLVFGLLIHLNQKNKDHSFRLIPHTKNSFISYTSEAGALIKNTKYSSSRLYYFLYFARNDKSRKIRDTLLRHMNSGKIPNPFVSSLANMCSFLGQQQDQWYRNRFRRTQRPSLPRKKWAEQQVTFSFITVCTIHFLRVLLFSFFRQFCHAFRYKRAPTENKLNILKYKFTDRVLPFLSSCFLSFLLLGSPPHSIFSVDCRSNSNLTSSRRGFQFDNFDVPSSLRLIIADIRHHLRLFLR